MYIIEIIVEMLLLLTTVLTCDFKEEYFAMLEWYFAVQMLCPDHRQLNYWRREVCAFFKLGLCETWTATNECVYNSLLRFKRSN